MTTPAQPDDPIPTRASLLSRLKDWDDQQSWQDFHDTYWKLIYSVALKAGLSDAEARDVVQETELTVAKRMREFKYDPALGSFKGWLLHTTRWRIADLLRKRGPQASPAPPPADGDARTATVERVPDPNALDWQSLWDEEWEKNVMDAALGRVKCKVNSKDYQMFDLYVLKNWSVADITRTLGVSVHQVYQARSRVGKRLKQEVAYLESKLL